jgi:predicted HTH domain antitoxin
MTQTSDNVKPIHKVGNIMTETATVKIAVELPRDVLSALRQDPESFVREMRLAAAIKWYELQKISQSKAAEIAGVSRSEFLKALDRFDVTPFQYSAEEIIREVEGA